MPGVTGKPRSGLSTDTESDEEQFSYLLLILTLYI